MRLMVTFSSQLITSSLYKLTIHRASFCPTLCHQNTGATAHDITTTCNHAHSGTQSLLTSNALLTRDEIVTAIPLSPPPPPTSRWSWHLQPSWILLHSRRWCLRPLPVLWQPGESGGRHQESFALQDGHWGHLLCQSERTIFLGVKQFFLVFFPFPPVVERWVWWFGSAWILYKDVHEKVSHLFPPCLPPLHSPPKDF